MLFENYGDKDYLKALVDGDDRKIGALYKEHYPMIYRFIISNNGTEDDARDIYQNAFMQLYKTVRAGTFRPEAGIGTYLYSVARRQWLTQLKKMDKVITRIFDFEAFQLFSTDEEDYFVEEDRKIKRLNKSLEFLGEPCRTLINDFYVHRLSMKEIVMKFGYTNTDNAKNQKYKCLQRLKKLFFSKQPQKIENL